MKRVLSVSFSVFIILILLLTAPFSIYADDPTPITGFDYTNFDELEYITFNKNSYIDTGLVVTNKDAFSINLKFSFASTYSYNGLFSLPNTGSPLFSLTGYISSNNKRMMLQYNTVTKTYESVTENTVYDLQINKSNGSHFVYKNNTTGHIDSFDDTTTFNYSLLIGITNGNNLSYRTFNGNLYYFSISYGENNTLYNYKFYPAKRKSDNVLGFYCTKNNTFYTFSGSGIPTAGPNVSYPIYYNISTDVSPSGSGNVSGAGSYLDGSTVTLTATPNNGYLFSKWSDDDITNPRTITVSQDKIYTAIFVPDLPDYTITTAVSPQGSGTVTGGGTYAENSSVTLTATPNTGFTFVKWSDNVTTNPRTITVTQNATYQAIFDETQTIWSDWTDEDDEEYLEDITSSIDLTKIYWSRYITRVIDFIEVYGSQYQINSGINGSNLSNISFLGSYYDNTITGLNGCNSTSYNYQTSSSTQVDVLTIEPAIYGSFDSPTVGQDGIVFNFGIDVNAGTSSNVTTTTSGFSNETQACRLIGMNTGDGSVDGTTLLSLGYEKKTITYNDGSANGHTATVYVPGDEEFEFAADLSFLDDLFEQLYINVTTSMVVHAHDEYTIELNSEEGYLLPEYGYVYSTAYIGVMFANVQGSTSSSYPFDYINNKFYVLPNDYTNATINTSFSHIISDNTYDWNTTKLYWSGTRNPSWTFKTDEIDLSDVPFANIYKTNDVLYNVWDTFGWELGIGDTYTVQSGDLQYDQYLTAGTLLPLNIDQIKFYQFKNNSLLNRFNQLGSFLNKWFRRVESAIKSVSGSSESNDIINNISEEYNVDVDLNLNGLLTNVDTWKNEIDLTDPEFIISDNDLTGIQSLAGSFERIYNDIYFDNGLGILVFVPLLLLVLRLIL